MAINSISSGVGCAHNEIECGIILEQAILGRIRRIRRRMNERERRCIAAGDVFVYSEEESKIKRWTDSRKWSPSRVQGSFMLYFETRSSNPMIKKTYSTIYNGLKYHIVFYSLLSEEKSRLCCQKYRNKPLKTIDNLKDQSNTLLFGHKEVSRSNEVYRDSFFREIDEEDDFIHKHSREFY